MSKIPSWMRSPWLVASLPLLLLALARSGSVAEGDPYWEVRAGLDMLNGAPIIRPDTWSWSAQGEIWTPNSWGWNVLLGLGWKAGEHAGLGAIVLVGSVAVYSLLFVLSRQRGALPAAAALAALGGGLALPQWLSPRPQLATYVFTLLLILLIPRVLTSRRWYLYVLLLGAMQVLAVNLHLAATSNVVLALGALSLWWVSRRAGGESALKSDTLRSASLLAALSLATLTSPLGLGILSHASGVRGESTLFLVEWLPGWSTWGSMWSILMAMLAAWWAWRSRRFEAAGAALAALLLAIVAVRFSPIAMLVAIPELASLLSAGVVGAWVRSRTRPLAVGALVLSCVLLPLAAVAVSSPGRPVPERYSEAAFSALPSGCRLLNGYVSGSYLPLARPDVPVSIDGRNDFYGDRRVLDQVAVWMDKPGSDEWLRTHQIDCILADFALREPRQLYTRLSLDPEWEHVYKDENHAVLVRKQPQAAQPL